MPSSIWMECSLRSTVIAACRVNLASAAHIVPVQSQEQVDWSGTGQSARKIGFKEPDLLLGYVG